MQNHNNDNGIMQKIGQGLGGLAGGIRTGYADHVNAKALAAEQAAEAYRKWANGSSI